MDALLNSDIMSVSFIFFASDVRDIFGHLLCASAYFQLWYRKHVLSSWILYICIFFKGNLIFLHFFYLGPKPALLALFHALNTSDVRFTLIRAASDRTNLHVLHTIFVFWSHNLGQNLTFRDIFTSVTSRLFIPIFDSPTFSERSICLSDFSVCLFLAASRCFFD